MGIRIWRLAFKSRRRRLWMWILDKACVEKHISMQRDQIVDYIDPHKKTTDLFLEFCIYRHVYRFGRGTHGLSFQFNVTRVCCSRHSLDPDLKYRVVSETYYGLSPDEYFEIMQDRIGRLGREEDGEGRWYVKKRKFDYHTDGK